MKFWALMIFLCGYSSKNIFRPVQCARVQILQESYYEWGLDERGCKQKCCKLQEMAN